MPGQGRFSAADVLDVASAAPLTGRFSAADILDTARHSTSVTDVPAPTAAPPRVPVAGRGTQLDVNRSDRSMFAAPFNGLGEALRGALHLGQAVMAPPSQIVTTTAKAAFDGAPPTTEADQAGTGPDNQVVIGTELPVAAVPVSRARLDKVITAGNEIIGGGFKALTPTLVAAGIAAPVATAAALSAAWLESQYVKTASQELGATEPEAQFLGDLSAIVAGSAAGQAASAARGTGGPTAATAADADAHARASAAKVLGVDPNADPDTVKTAYYAKAKESHPDVNPDADPATMQNINVAYAWLRDHPATETPSTASIADWVKQQATWLRSKVRPTATPTAPAAADVATAPAELAAAPPVEEPAPPPAVAEPPVVPPEPAQAPVIRDRGAMPAIRTLSPGEEAGIRDLEYLQQVIYGGEDVPTKGNGTFKPDDVVEVEPMPGTSGEPPLANPHADVLDTGEVQPRLPEAGAVRDQQVATPEFEAPFSLTPESAERTGVQPGMRFDSAPQEAQTTADEPGSPAAGEGHSEANREPLLGIPESVATRPENRRQRDARRTAHYDDVFAHLLDRAREVDPTVDPTDLRRQFDDRVDLHDELVDEAAEHAPNLRTLLTTIAKLGGISDAGGAQGEVRWLKEASSRFGTFAGVAKVFQKRYVRGNGTVDFGHSLSEMASLLRGGDYPDIQDEHDLLAVLEDAARGGSAAHGQAFPGTAELARKFGMSPKAKWWADAEDAAPEAPAAAPSETSEAGLEDADTSFDPTDFENGGGGGGAASVGRYAEPAARTPAFRRWFRRSKVVQADGAPRVVYHGSNRRFDVFEPRETKRNVDGDIIDVAPQAFYFSEDAASSRRFARDRALIDERLRGKKPGRPEVRAFYLSVQNPIDFTGGPGIGINAEAAAELEDIAPSYAVNDWNDIQAALDDPHIVEELRLRGYDGARLEENDGTTTWAVFEPTQIKSATHNVGTFDSQTASVNANVGTFSDQQPTTGTIPPRADARLLFPPPPNEGGRAGGVSRPVEFPELVDLARALQGVPKVVKSFRTPGKRGEFSAAGIRIVGDLFKPGNEYQLAATLAHEIGHLIDWLPNHTLKRGNLLGRLRSLSSFLKHTFTAEDGTTIKNKDVRRELQALSDEWRPWDKDTASASFRAYRQSGKELYADALSVLLNNPGMLQAKAPTFYRQFFENLDAKPEVERAYFDLQELLSGTKEELIARRRAGVRRMFEEGDVTAREIEQRKIDEQAARNKNLWFRLKTQLVDKNFAVIDRVRAAQQRGEVIPDDLNPVYFLEERNYLGGQLKGFTERAFLPVFKAVTGAGIHWNAFGEALFYERIIAGDRSAVANPRGLSPDVATELYDSLKRELGPAAVAVLEREIGAFRAAVKQTAEEAYEAGLYTDELHEQMLKNPAYATYQVIDHLENGVSSRVYKQVGTLKDIVNVADSTILKTLVTKRAIEHQKVKVSVLGFLALHYPNEIADAKTVWSGKGHRPIESKDPNQRLVTYFEKGQLKGKYVDPFIADALENESIGQNLAVVSILRRVNSGIFRPLFTTFNLGFQSFNFIRDFTRFWKNTPGMTVGRALQRYWQSLPLARARAFGIGIAPSAAQQAAYADLIAAEEAKMLSVTFNDLVTGRQVEDTQIEDILARSGVGGIGTHARLWYTRPFLAVLDLIREAGDFIETLPKAAGIYEYKGRGSIGQIPASTRSFIRRKVGSPDFLAAGTAKPIINEVFLYSNAAIQAIRSDFEVATEPRTRSGWWWKTAQRTLLPKLLMFAGLLGLMGEETRRLLERASEYDRTNYTVLPIGDDGHGNAVYVRLPDDQTGQLIGGLFWKMLRALHGDTGVIESASQIADYTAGQIPSVSPSVQAVGAAGQFVAGQNPYDAFRGRNVFTDDEWRAHDLHTTKKFVGWEFQQLGGGIVWKFYPGEERPKTETSGQHLLELPIVSNILGRFIRITAQGDTEALRQAQADVQRDEARRRLTERERTDDAIRTYLQLPPAQRTPAAVTRLAATITADLYGQDAQEATKRFPELQAKLRRGVARGEADPFMDAVLAATSNAQKLAIVEAWLKRTGTVPVPAAAR